jgi:hypothetical protein
MSPRLSWLAALVLLAAASAANAATCLQPEINGVDFDFSSLSSPVAVQGTYSGSSSTFYLAPCASIAASAVPTSVGTNCQTATGGPYSGYQSEAIYPYNCYGLAYASPFTWSAVDSSDMTKGVTLLMSTGSKTGSSNTRQIQITFYCDPSATGATKPLFLTENGNSAAKTIAYTYSWTTALACGGSSGLSGGSIFMIIVLVVTVVYFAGGYAYMYKKHGARGVEAIPNLEFWRNLPGLVKDGWMFVVDKVRNKYQSVK